MGRSRASKDTVRAANRTLTAVELRIAGKTFDEIGRQLSVSKVRAWQLVTEALAETRAQTPQKAEELKEIEVERTEAIIKGLWTKRSDPRVADTILRAQERLARYHGHDAPQKMEHSVNVHDARRRIMEEIAKETDTGETGGNPPTAGPRDD